MSFPHGRWLTRALSKNKNLIGRRSERYAALGAAGFVLADLPLPPARAMNRLEVGAFPLPRRDFLYNPIGYINGPQNCENRRPIRLDPLHNLELIITI
jgi:hypothetical protein